MKKLYFFVSSMLMALLGFAQSQPFPFDLSQGNYLFSQWDSLAPASTFPPSMVFHTMGAQQASMADTGKADWSCAYNLNAGPRFKGKGLNGIGMVNTGSSQSSNCASDTLTPIYVGETVLSLNTTGRSNIQLSWIGRMVSSFNYVPSPGSNPVNRFYGLVCQYRVGTTGPFQTFSNDSIFLCNLNDTTYHPQGFADTLGATALPVICEDQPVVQLRWLYFQTNNGQGPRPELAIDDISVTSDLATQLIRNLNSKSISVSPNPSYTGLFLLSQSSTFRILDLQGKEIRAFQTGNRIDLADMPKGIYLLQTVDGNYLRLAK